MKKAMVKTFLMAIGLLLTLGFTLWNGETFAQEKQLSAEVWFQCEFAHSRIPPDDDCRMLDDDGFLLVEGLIYHVKVSDSKETGCRGERVGHCFSRSRPEVTVEGTEIGPLNRTAEGFIVDYFGCTQRYQMVPLTNFVKVTPAGEHCFWTPDKHYYIARYKGRLKSAED